MGLIRGRSGSDWFRIPGSTLTKTMPIRAELLHNSMKNSKVWFLLLLPVLHDRFLRLYHLFPFESYSCSLVRNNYFVSFISSLPPCRHCLEDKRKIFSITHRQSISFHLGTFGPFAPWPSDLGRSCTFFCDGSLDLSPSCVGGRPGLRMFSA